MKQVLEPLARIPGVRSVALVTNDGVPIITHGRPMAAPAEHARVAEEDGRAWKAEPREELEYGAQLAALATGWMNEIQRATGPLSWDAPHHLVLRAARGTLVVRQAPGALLILVLESGTSEAELRLPLDAAVARIQRHLRAIGAKPSNESAAGSVPLIDEEPRGLFPIRNQAQLDSSVETKTKTG